MPEIETITIPADYAPDRADKTLAAALGLSRTRAQHLLEDGRITTGNPPRPVTSKERLSPGDILQFDPPTPPETTPTPADIPLSILYEDAHLLAINKPSTLITHPGAGVTGPTLVHAALHHTSGQLAPAGGELRPGIVHRLDKETTGVILLAKTDEAHADLVRQFSEHLPVKQYIALVDAAPGLLSGSVREPVGRHPSNRVKMAVRDDGKPAWTEWVVEERFGTQAARIRCWLHTGRTHLIRVHLAHLGHPLLGDASYGRAGGVREGWPVFRVMLHAQHIAFTHPVTGEPLEISAPIPPDFPALETWLREQFGSSPVGG
jgi:23S rRNA pseudouridine1911/1915/1917 synthase